MELSAKNIEDLYASIVAELVMVKNLDCVSKYESLVRVLNSLRVFMHEVQLIPSSPGPELGVTRRGTGSR